MLFSALGLALKYLNPSSLFPALGLALKYLNPSLLFSALGLALILSTSEKTKRANENKENRGFTAEVCAKSLVTELKNTVIKNTTISGDDTSVASPANQVMESGNVQLESENEKARECLSDNPSKSGLATSPTLSVSSKSSRTSTALKRSTTPKKGAAANTPKIDEEFIKGFKKKKEPWILCESDKRKNLGVPGRASNADIPQILKDSEFAELFHHTKNASKEKLAKLEARTRSSKPSTTLILSKPRSAVKAGSDVMETAQGGPTTPDLDCHERFQDFSKDVSIDIGKEPHSSTCSPASGSPRKSRRGISKVSSKKSKTTPKSGKRNAKRSTKTKKEDCNRNCVTEALPIQLQDGEALSGTTINIKDMEDLDLASSVVIRTSPVEEILNGSCDPSDEAAIAASNLSQNLLSLPSSFEEILSNREASMSRQSGMKPKASVAGHADTEVAETLLTFSSKAFVSPAKKGSKKVSEDTLISHKAKSGTSPKASARQRKTVSTGKRKNAVDGPHANSRHNGGSGDSNERTTVVSQKSKEKTAATKKSASDPSRARSGNKGAGKKENDRKTIDSVSDAKSTTKRTKKDSQAKERAPSSIKSSTKEKDCLRAGKNVAGSVTKSTAGLTLSTESPSLNQSCTRSSSLPLAKGFSSPSKSQPLMALIEQSMETLRQGLSSQGSAGGGIAKPSPGKRPREDSGNSAMEKVIN